MGVSRSPAELADKFQRYAFAFGAANREAVQSAALTYKEQLLRNAERDAGPDRRLSRWRRRFGASRSGTSPKLNAGYDLFGFDNAKAILRPRPYGIWALLEEGAQPHVIRPFRYVRGARKGQGNSALKFPDGGFAAFAQHPGTPPKRTFTDATRIAEPRAMRVFGEAHRRSLLEVFR
jgi:hypothetical protein